MADLDVRIERLPPMRVAWVRAVGRSPEEEAWQQLRGWAGPAGLLDDPDAHPVFGFNNPGPSAGEPAYGYELWIAVDAGTQPPPGVAVKDFAGGTYAVTSCRLTGPPGVLETWRALLRWVHTSRHTWRRDSHELERLRNPLAAPPEMMLDLYLPIEEGRTRRRVGPRRPTSIGGASANGAGDRLAKTASFSLDRRAQSFRFAWRGLVAVARTQHNAWIHGGATVAILAAGLALRLNVGEWAPLVLAMAAVWAAEAFNTAIEVLGDAVAADDHPLVGRAKDVAAGGVLVTAVGAVAVGLLVLVPRALEALGRS